MCDLEKIFLNFDEDVEESKEPPCRGIFFRYSSSSYISSHNSIEYRQSFRLLKRKSCTGCKYCQQLWEDFSMSGEVDGTVHLPSNLISGAMYEAIFVPGPVDWETGYCDDWWWELKKVEEK